MTKTPPKANNDRALLVIAHGSRAAPANTEFLTLIGTLRENQPTSLNQYQYIEGVFLELGAPSLSQAVEKLVDQGVAKFDVYPLFFNCGKHVSKDIPALVAEVEYKYKNISIRLLEYFGSSTQLTKAVINHVEQQG